MKLTITVSILLYFISSVQAFTQHPSLIDSLLQKYDELHEDTVKVELLGKLYNYYLYRDQKEAKKYAEQELALAKRLSQESGISMGHYHLGVYYNNLGNSDSAHYHYAEAKKIAKKIGDVRHMSDINHAMAIQEFYRGQLDSALAMTMETIAMNKEIKDSAGLAISLDFLGMIHQNKGNYNIALNYIHKGLDIFQKVGDSIRLADSFNHLAAIESNLGNYKKSIEYNLIAFGIYERFEDLYYQAQALNDIAQMYLKLEDFENCQKYIELGLDKAAQAKGNSLRGTLLTNYGKMLIAQGSERKALEYLDEALELQVKLKETRKQIITKNQIAFAYNQLSRPTDAIAILNDVIKTAEAIDSKSTLQYAYQYRSEAHKLLNNYQQAMDDFNMYKILSDTLFNKEKSRQIEELRTIHDLEQKEYEIVLKEEEIKVLNSSIALANLKKTSYAVGMVCFIAIAILIFYSFRQRLKKKEIERKKQEEIYRNELEHKKKQLISQTLHLVQKSTFIQELKDNLASAGKNQEQFKVEIRRIAMLLRKETALEKDWETFKSYFIDVHNDFESKIKRIYSDVSEKEIRLASFLKMNLTTKEIASILNVMPDSVLKSKYRLKKKLKLGKEEDLYQFLKSI